MVVPCHFEVWRRVENPCASRLRAIWFSSRPERGCGAFWDRGVTAALRPTEIASSATKIPIGILASAIVRIVDRHSRQDAHADQADPAEQRGASARVEKIEMFG